LQALFEKMQVNKEENDQIRRDLKDTKKDFDDLEANNVSFNNRLLFVTDDVVIACLIHFFEFHSDFSKMQLNGIRKQRRKKRQIFVQ